MASNTTKLTFAGIMALAFIGMALTMTVSAEVHDRFGEQVLFGDADFIPTLSDTGALEVCVVTFGENNANDWAFYLKVPHNTGTSEVERDDLRLVEYSGNGIGTLVRDADTVEIGQSCANTIGTVAAVYGDVNNNGRYDNGDYVWLTGNAGDNFVATSDAASEDWTIRLTETNGGAAGTVVFSQDTDRQDYASNSLEFNSAGQIAFFNVDGALSGTDDRFTEGDHLYLAVPYQDGTQTVAAGELVPLHSVRLHGPGGAFGTQVDLGDNDHIPLLNEMDGGLAGAPASPICVADIEGDGLIEDFVVYVNLNAAFAGTPVVERNYLRLTDGPGGGPGTLVRSSDNTELDTGCDTNGVNARYADRNNNGRYDEGDWVFLSSDADIVATSDTNTDWTIRLTGTDSGDTGSFVRTGDNDLTTYGGDNNAMATTVGFGVMDRDRSGAADSTRILTRGDSIYLMRGLATTSAENLVPLYSIRLMEEEFGTQVTFGDSDFRPTLMDFDDIDAYVCVVELGDDIQDFGFYMIIVDDGATAPTTVPRHAVRLVEAQGNPVGSLVRTADTSEIGQTCEENPDIDPSATATATQVSIHYSDLNNNGRYDEGDNVYLVFDSATNVEDRDGIVSSSSATQWSIRLTGDNAGSLVFSGDQDLINYSDNADNLADGEVHWFDADLRGSFSRGDTLYVSPEALTSQELVVLYSVRVSGELPVTAPPPAPPTDEDEADDGAEDVDDDGEDDGVTPPPPADDDGAEDDDGVTPPPADDDDDQAEEEPTPGPAAIIVLALIGGALVALRRRK